MALIFVGSYTEKRTDGVFVFRFDEKSGVLTQIGAFDAGPNPSYLALHPTLPMLYAVQEVGTGDGTTPTTGGFVTALPIESGGMLKKGLHTRVSSHGAYPCWVSVHPDKRHLLVANYTSGNGSVCVVPLSTAGDVGEASDHTRLGPNGTNSCAHCLVAAPGGKHVVAADIKQNKLFIYDFDSVRGLIAPHANPPYYSLPGPTTGLPEGAGPRHIAFSPNGRFLYCLTEYAATVSVFPWNPNGKPADALQTLPLLPADFKGKNSSAALHLSRTANFCTAPIGAMTVWRFSPWTAKPAN